MNLYRPPVNGFQPRTTRESGASPRDWWEGPQHPDPHIYDTATTPAWHAWAYVAVCLAAVAAIAVMLSTGV